jgi:CarboxypepD_reg-like domain
MRNFFLVMLFLGFSVAGLSQRILISGKVTDKETQEPLTYASVGIKGKSLSTITNQIGEFDFHIPIELRNNFIVINMLGYKTYEAPIWSILDIKPLIIEMEKSPLQLDEVVISDSLRGGDVLQIALFLS